MKAFQNSEKIFRKVNHRRSPFSFAIFRGNLKNKAEYPFHFAQKAFVDKVLFYRIASSFSPMKYSKNRIVSFLDNWFFERI